MSGTPRPKRPRATAIDGPKPGPRHAPRAATLTAARLRTGGAGRSRLPDAAEAAQRASWGELQTLRPAYAHLLTLGEQGRGREHARRMVDRIEDVIAQGGWTDSERVTLYQARNKWRRRRDGQDPRYLLTGGEVRGVLPETVQRGVTTMRTVQGAIEDVAATVRRLREQGAGDEQ